MSGRTVLEMNSLVTQTAEAVKSLIKLYNHGQDPAEMPPFFRLSAEMVLVQSNKGRYLLCNHAARLFLPREALAAW